MGKEAKRSLIEKAGDHGLTLFFGSIACYMLSPIFPPLVYLGALLLAPIFLAVVGAFLFQIWELFQR